MRPKDSAGTKDQKRAVEMLRRQITAKEREERMKAEEAAREAARQVDDRNRRTAQ